MAIMFGIPVMIFYVYVYLYCCDGFCGERRYYVSFVDAMDNCFNHSKKLFKVCVMGASISCCYFTYCCVHINVCDVMWHCDVEWDYFGGGDNP